MILDMSYTLAMFRQRQLDQALESRSLDGFFDQVISVHPLAGLFDPGTDRYGDPIVTQLDEAHTFVEGRVGMASWMRAVPPLNFVAAQVRLVRLLVSLARRGRISLVRAGDPYYLGLLGWLLARLLRVPLAVRVPFRYDEIRRITGRAVMPRLFRFGWIEKRIERFVFARCDLIAGANEDNMRYGIENGGRPDVATVFRYGNLLHQAHWMDPAARPNAEEDLAALGLSGRRFTVTVSRLEPMKRVEDVVRVAGDLLRRGHDVCSLIVGEGSLQEPLEAQVRSAGLEGRVVFAGNRNQEWIARVLPHGAAIVSPHMGRGLVEAALGAVPLVAYDYDWQREIVIDGETGYLVDNGDWRVMAERVEQLLMRPETARAMGLSARAMAFDMMDPQRLMDHEQATYARLIEQWPTIR